MLIPDRGVMIQRGSEYHIDGWIYEEAKECDENGRINRQSDGPIFRRTVSDAERVNDRGWNEGPEEVESE